MSLALLFETRVSPNFLEDLGQAIEKPERMSKSWKRLPGAQRDFPRTRGNKRGINGR
jgi:hypothetical protein